MSATVIQTTGLNFRYGDGTGALRGIDLSIRANCKTAFLGPNGAGKSTFFLHCNGLLRPTAGKISFRGRDIEYNKTYLKMLRQRVGIVFQNPDQQLFSASVLQDISFGLINNGVSKEEARARIYEIGGQLGIEELFERPTHHLSIGQKKLVALAGVLVMHPQLLILDEPTAGLDPAAAVNLVDILEGLHQQGTSVLISTHDVDQAYTWADHIVVLERGQMLVSGSPGEVFADLGVLGQARLQKPWIVETWELMQGRRLVPAEESPPRTRAELMQKLGCV